MYYIVNTNWDSAFYTYFVLDLTHTISIIKNQVNQDIIKEEINKTIFLGHSEVWEEKRRKALICVLPNTHASSVLILNEGPWHKSRGNSFVLPQTPDIVLPHIVIFCVVHHLLVFAHFNKLISIICQKLESLKTSE